MRGLTSGSIVRYQQVRNGMLDLNQDQEERRKFNDGLKQLLDTTLQTAAVICTSVFHSTNPEIVCNVNPAIIAVNEAPRAPELTL